MNEFRRVNIIVEGRVQGVGFRWFAIHAARELGIKGWVRNNFDGTVETAAEGESEAIGEFIGKLRKGPITARVTGIAVTEENYTGEFSGFDIRY